MSHTPSGTAAATPMQHTGFAADQAADDQAADAQDPTSPR